MVIISSTEGIDGKSFAIVGFQSLGHKIGKELLNRGASHVVCLGSESSEKSHDDAALIFGKENIGHQSFLADKLSAVDCVIHGCDELSSSNQAIVHSQIKATNSILNSCILCNIPRLVLVSSYDSIAFNSKSNNEFSILVDEELRGYGSLLASAEEIVASANGNLLQNGHGRIQTCVLRAAPIYSADFSEASPAGFIHSLASKPIVVGFGNPNSKVDVLNVDNLVHAILGAVSSLAEGGGASVVGGKPYFISDGNPINIFEFLKPILKAKGSIRVWIPASLVVFLCKVESLPPRGLQLPLLSRIQVIKFGVNRHFSTESARADFGYQPIRDQKEGISKIVSHLKNELSRSIERPGAIVLVLIPMGVLLLTLAAFTVPPAMGPLEAVRELGVIIFMSVDNLKLVWQLAVAIHVLESAVAFVLASAVDPSNVWEWVLQTMIYGFFSLRLLLRKKYSE